MREVDRKSPKSEKRLVEIDYIIEGLNADRTIARLYKEKWELKNRLIKEGIDLGDD